MIPIAVVLTAIGIFLGNELRAARLLRHEVDVNRAAGDPVDDRSLSQHFFDSTSQDQTVAWREVGVATEHVEHRAVHEYGLSYSSWDGTDFPGLPPPTATAERLLLQTQLYLGDAAPVIASMDRLSRDVKPTWQPVAFSGFSTLFPDVQASMAIHRLLGAEFNHAVHIMDSARALRALQLDAATSEAYDWQFSAAIDMMNMGRHLGRHKRIHASLALELWNEEHLSSLSQLVGDQRDITRRWRQIFSNERAMYLTHVRADSSAMFTSVLPGWNSKGDPIFFPASLKLASLQRLNRAITVADDGYAGLKHRAQVAALPAAWPLSYRIIRKWVGSSEDFDRLTTSLLAGVENYAALCVTFENSRRMTKTAIAIKQYQLRNKKWADNLGELQAVGLPVQEWKLVNGQAFGYRVEPHQTQAVLSTSGDVRHAQSELSVVTIR